MPICIKVRLIGFKLQRMRTGNGSSNINDAFTERFKLTNANSALQVYESYRMIS